MRCRLPIAWLQPFLVFCRSNAAWCGHAAGSRAGSLRVGACAGSSSPTVAWWWDVLPARRLAQRNIRALILGVG